MTFSQNLILKYNIIQKDFFPNLTTWKNKAFVQSIRGATAQSWDVSVQSRSHWTIRGVSLMLQLMDGPEH